MPSLPLFLERASFRRRRLGDAARILPVLATALVVVPVWWIPEHVATAAGVVWLFGLWACLIAATAALHCALQRANSVTRPTGEAIPKPVARDDAL